MFLGEFNVFEIRESLRWNIWGRLWSAAMEVEEVGGSNAEVMAMASWWISEAIDMRVIVRTCRRDEKWEVRWEEEVAIYLRTGREVAPRVYINIIHAENAWNEMREFLVRSGRDTSAGPVAPRTPRTAGTIDTVRNQFLTDTHLHGKSQMQLRNQKEVNGWIFVSPPLDCIFYI